jgi:hypothetical protein
MPQLADDEDGRVMARLGDLEREIGAPGFWERPPDVVEALCKEHVAAFAEALRRGLVARIDGNV